MITSEVVPPGGWVYQQGPHKLRAETLKELIEMVRQHRESNKLIISDVEGEVKQQIQRLHPHLILGE